MNQALSELKENLQTDDKKARAAKSFPIDLVMGASVMAQRINGKYIKRNEVKSSNGSNVEGMVVPNYGRMVELLRRPESIPQDAIDEGVAIRDYYLSDYMLRILAHPSGIPEQALVSTSGEGWLTTTNTFDLGIYTALNRETVELSYFSHIACLPSVHARAVARNELNNAITEARGNYVSQIGEKVKLSFSVTRRREGKFGGYNYEAITTENQLIGFSTPLMLEVGSKLKIETKVKAHHENGVTYLGGRGVKTTFHKIFEENQENSCE